MSGTEEKKEEERTEENKEDKEALEKELDEIQQRIEEKKKQVKDEEAEAEKRSSDDDETRKTLKEAPEKLSEAQKELEEAEREKTLLEPEVERMKENQSIKEKAANLNEEIKKLEDELAANQKENERVDAELQEESQKYKEETSKREKLLSDFKGHLDEFMKVIADKIDKTVPIDTKPKEEGGVNPFDTLEISEELLRERERAISNTRRLCRENEAIVEMQEEKKEKLGSETEKMLEDRRREKDECIKEMIYSFQDERNALQSDIDEIRKVNSQQANNLRRGHVERRMDPNEFRRAKSPVVNRKRDVQAHARHSTFRKEAPVPSEIKLLQQKNRELLDELGKLKKELQATQTEKTEVLKATKGMEVRVKRDHEDHLRAIHQVESQIIAEKQLTDNLEKENSRLSEVVEQLSITVKTTRKHLQVVRAKAQPLPIEE